MGFRQDINGLRAIAVLAVVLFHFNPKWLPGGFIGVDVFFVISGFLMTSIIFSGLNNNTFNLFKFYNARINRIFPVLATLFTVLLIFGWFYLIPNNYKELGTQIQQSSLFISNHFFAKGGGYFDTSENSKWLLHTWSLSIEWQFYIFFPIIILTFKKYLNFSQIKPAIVFLFLTSFIYSIYATSVESKTAYFSLTVRAWELLLGSLAFLYPWPLKQKLYKFCIQCLGIFLIFSSYFLITKEIPWPGYIALLPVLGAYLIIISNYQNNLIINNPLFSHIGKWSYSIYVWHWPLVVFGFYIAYKDWWLYGIPLSIVFGFLSYQLIEKINCKRYIEWKDIYKVKPALVLLITLFISTLIQLSNGLDSRGSEPLKTILNEKNNSNPNSCMDLSQNADFTPCILGDKSNLKVIIAGDSHADSTVSAITSIMDLKKEGVLVLNKSGCAFVFNNSEYCHIVNQKRIAILNKYRNIPIIVINRYGSKLEGENDPNRNSKTIEPSTQELDRRYNIFESDFESSICKLSQHAPVYVLFAIPEQGQNIPNIMAKQLYESGYIKDNSISLDQYLKRSNRVNSTLARIAHKCNAKILDPTQILCTTGKCISEYRGRPIYRDGDHLSEYGNKLLTPLFKEVINP